MHREDAPGDDEPRDAALTERLSDMRTATDDATTKLTRSVAKARIANALFASDHQVNIGRYRLLERAGHGGMGVVWSAWDPELERRVAIKVMRATAQSAREQMLREGQALAKLSHPNVVPVFDVGIIDDQVYLVMEWVRGGTLRELCSGEHSMREIVHVYRQVCAGLGAAHRAGVVHRDFKPDNAIRGEDGRVRVLDFGLAVQEAAASGIAGTPRYMAPEQAAGSAVTAAADQYACCTSLREALLGDGSRSIPRWLEAIVARGTAADPAARFSSMDALAAALDNDPGRRWRRRGAVLATATGVALAFAVGKMRSTAPSETPCKEAANLLPATWSPTVRRTMTDHVRALGAFGAHEGERLGDEFTNYAAAWSSARAAACLAYARSELTPVGYETRLRCLGRSEAAFAAAIEVASEATADNLSRALIAARSLPNPSGCVREDALDISRPPQAMAATVDKVAAAVERARILAIADNPRAIDAANAAATAAEATGYMPLFARATMVQGWARSSDDLSAAHQLLKRAFRTAFRAGDDVLAIEAFARAWYVASRTADFRPSEPERLLVEDLASRTGEPGRFSRALLYNNLAAARLAVSDRVGARDLFRQALSTWRPPLGDPAHDLELSAVLRNLALVEDEPVRRVELSQRAVDSQQLQLGADHPNTIDARIQLALLTSDPVASARVFAQTCAAIPVWHPRLQVDCAYGEAWLAIDRGDARRATAAMATAHARGGDSQHGQIAGAYLDVTSGDRGRISNARDAMVRLAHQLSAADNGWWDHADAADAWIVVGIAEAAMGQNSASTRAWQNALGQLGDHAILERRRARVHATLAKRLIESRSTEARAHATAAITWYRAAGGYDTDIAELTRTVDETR